MKKFLLAAFVCLLSLNLSIGDAEAARLGGGRSIGMQRQAVTPRPAAPAQQAAPAPARHVAGLARSPVWRPDWALPRSSRTSAWGLVWPM